MSNVCQLLTAILLVSGSVLNWSAAVAKDEAAPSASDPESREVDIPGLFWELASPNQVTRDAAAEKLRTSYVAAQRDKWMKLLAEIKFGDSKQEILRQVSPDPLKPESGLGTGQRHMEEYRLDDRWLLSAWFNNADDTLHKATLTERLRHVWVVPPDDFTGVWITYHVNGQTSHEIHYRDGKYDGPFTTYHPNGTKAVVQNYGSQGIDGEDTGYFPTGEVSYRAFYQAGSPVGTWTWYNKDGSIRTTRQHGYE